MSRKNNENEKVEVNKNELPRSEAKKHIEEKKNKENKRIARMRPLKNFLFWLFGVLSSVGIVLSSVFIALKVVPMSTFVGKDNLDGVVSEEVADDSIVDFLFNFNDYSFGDFPIIEQSLSEALGGKELAILSDYQAVDTPNLTETIEGGTKKYTVEEGVDHTLYYYEVESSGSSPFSTPEKTYARAFDDNGVLVAELASKVSNDQEINLYFQPLTKFPVTTALLHIGTYIQFVPVSDLLSIAGMGEETFVNDIFEGIVVGDFMKSPEEGGFSMGTVLNRLTLDSFGGAELLGDLGNFEFFKSFAIVDERPEVVNGYITKDGEEFTSNPALYYVLVAEGATEDEDTFARAFTDDGEFIKNYYVDENGKVYTEPKGDESPTLSFTSFDDVDSELLRFANLAKVPLSQTLELLGESIGRQTINGMFEGLGMTVDQDSLISELFGEYTIEDFTKDPSEGGFDINTVKLVKLLGEETEENKDLYKLLCSVVKSDTEITTEELAVGHLLNGFNIDGVVVSDFIALDADTLELLCSAINPAKKLAYEDENIDNPDALPYQEVTASTLTIGDLKYFNQDDIKISVMLGDYKTNKSLYDVILSANGLLPDRPDGMEDAEYEAIVKPIAEDLSVSSLSGIDTDNVLLTVVLPENGNENLYEILLSALTVTDTDDVTVITNPTASDVRLEHLSGFSATKIKLSSVLELPTEENGHRPLYNILSQATGGTPFEELTVGHLDGFDLHTVKLSSVLDPAEDPDLYKVLVEIYPNKDVINDLTIEDLRDFDVSGVRLGTVFPQSSNPEIYKVFGDALNLGEVHTVDGEGNPKVLPAIEGSSQGEKLSKVHLYEIEARLDIKHIHLSTVLEWEEGQSTGNAVLDSLLNDNVTVGDIADKMNTMSLYKIYGESCFIESGTMPGDRFKRTEVDSVVTYELDADGDYVINQNSGIWLLLCFNAESVDATGRTTKYVSSDLTMESLEDSGSTISSRIVNSTIRQLVTAGIIDDSGFNSTAIYNLTISQVLQKVDDALAGGLIS